MAESAVKFLLDKLATILENEVQLWTEAQKEIVYLRGQLEHLIAFLRDADAIEESDEELKVWVRQIREISHDAEDVLDELKFLHPPDHGNSIYSHLSKLPRCMKKLKDHYRIQSKLQSINDRLRNECKIEKRLRKKLSEVADNSGNNTALNSWKERREDALLLDEADLVGIEERKHHLIGLLINERSGRGVVPVAGMGGIGKTTLAKQVYDDARVKKHFKVRTWLTVSQPFNLPELLKDMVKQLYEILKRRHPEEVDSMNNTKLKKTIKELLQKKRYLVVLDDVWKPGEWETIKLALPNNSNGSKVVLTTRNGEVAASTTALESEGEVYNLEPLPPIESWDLFCRKTFQGKACPPHLEEVCRYILRKCEGLPLAIVAVSGLLATKDTRRIDEWDMIKRCLGAEIDGNDKLIYLKKVLSLSFSDLPYHLKSCFLYLSIFPEHHLIEHMRLIRLWIAEGFIEAKEGKTYEDVAEDYLNELMNRGLLQVASSTVYGRVKTLRIHDLVREIIISKSRDQNFATVSKKDQNFPWPDKVRRLSIHHTLEDVNVQQNRFVSQLRSLFMFGVTEKVSLGRLFPYGVKLLHVLDLANGPFYKFPTEVCSLHHLKYLSLRNTKVKMVPRSIGFLQNLETLDLKHSLVSELPDEIQKLQKLRHLLVYRFEVISYAHFHSKHGFKTQANIGLLRSLQKLCFIEADQCGGSILKELRKLTQLRRLGITKFRKEDGETLCASIEKLSNLRALSIGSIEEEEVIDLQHLSSPPLLLQRLYLRGRLETFPHWIPSLYGLVRLHLKWSRLNEDPLMFVQHLPNLIHLQLCQAFDGDMICFRAGGFKKLKLLELDTLDELRCIVLEEGTMPIIEKLVIQHCKSLEKVPLGIEYLSQLKVLEFSHMPEKLIRTLRADEKEKDSDYGKIKHIPEVYCTDWIEGNLGVSTVKERLGDGENTPQLNTVIEPHELETRFFK